MRPTPSNKADAGSGTGLGIDGPMNLVRSPKSFPLLSTSRANHSDATRSLGYLLFKAAAIVASGKISFSGSSSSRSAPNRPYHWAA
jgi:hypothetical protein